MSNAVDYKSKMADLQSQIYELREKEVLEKIAVLQRELEQIRWEKNNATGIENPALPSPPPSDLSQPSNTRPLSEASEASPPASSKQNTDSKAKGGFFSVFQFGIKSPLAKKQDSKSKGMSDALKPSPQRGSEKKDRPGRRKSLSSSIENPPQGQLLNRNQAQQPVRRHQRNSLDPNMFARQAQAQARNLRQAAVPSPPPRSVMLSARSNQTSSPYYVALQEPAHGQQEISHPAANSDISYASPVKRVAIVRRQTVQNLAPPKEKTGSATIGRVTKSPHSRTSLPLRTRHVQPTLPQQSPSNGMAMKPDDLLAGIRKGVQLKKVQPITETNKPSPAPVSTGSSLLAELKARQKKTCKVVDDNWD
jgi:hypothetical protein